MKSLYLIRHAKSSWDNPGLNDLERPLNKRGKQNAPMMGKLLNKLGVRPDLIISSPAKRAKSTAKRIAIETGYPESNISSSKLLYMADVNDFIEVILNTGDKINKLMIFSHNYGITDFANYISDSNIENIPTCGVVKIDFKFDSWNKIKKEKGKLVFFEYPKKHPNGI